MNRSTIEQSVRKPGWSKGRIALALLVIVIFGVAGWAFSNAWDEVRAVKKQSQQKSEELEEFKKRLEQKADEHKACRADRSHLVEVAKNAASPWVPGAHLVCVTSGRSGENKKKICYMFGPAVRGDDERRFILRLEEVPVHGWKYQWGCDDANDDDPNGFERYAAGMGLECLGFWYESYGQLPSQLAPSN